LLTDDLKKQIQVAYSEFLAGRDLRARSGQKQMIAQIARCIGNITVDSDGKRDGEGHVCLVEAGTGTGKTVAYLLSAIPLALARDKKLVLSTATVALQEQLVEKDLPALLGIEGLKVKFVLAKGRGRYLCVSQLERQLVDQQQLGQIALYEDELAQKLDAETVSLYKSMLNDFAAGRWDGDRDNLQMDLDERDWQPVTSDHLQCTNRRCQHLSVCPFFKAREALDHADVVVANHDLVLADLALGGGAILPEPSDALYIFDEGHHLAQKTKGHFSYSIRLKGARRWLASLEKHFTRMLSDCQQQSTLTEYVEKLQVPLKDLDQSLERTEQLVSLVLEKQVQDNGRDQRYRFAGGRIPETLQSSAVDLARASERAVSRTELIVNLLKEAIDGGIAEIDKDIAEQWYPRIGQAWSRLQGYFWLARSYQVQDAPDQTPTARWVNLVETNDGWDYECCSSPVSAAGTLQEHLWDACYGAVVTSATLTALGRFDRVLADLGLEPGTAVAKFDSPFDYRNSATLRVPQMLADPSNPEEHTDEVASFLSKQLPDAKSTLVLFSSWKQMFRVLEQLDDSIKNKVLAQGDYSKQEILRLHRERIDEQQVSIIFGQASFAEGVDLPGQYLTEVIITKLPFSVPDDPVDATMGEWIDQQGGNAFAEWTIPMTSMRLTQAVGRLLRTEQDQGSVILLDKRIVSRRYGRQLLDSLPPFRRQFS